MDQHLQNAAIIHFGDFDLETLKGELFTYLGHPAQQVINQPPHRLVIGVL